MRMCFASNLLKLGHIEQLIFLLFNPAQSTIHLDGWLKIDEIMSIPLAANLYPVMK